jgi:hypothetical protein
MANGYNKSNEKWGRMEAPLRSLDSIFGGFSLRYGLSLSRNSHSCPERSFTRHGQVRRLIQVYLADESELTWHLWICASEDRKDGRYWKNAFLRRAMPTHTMQSEIEGLLEAAWSQLSGWSGADLERAPEVKGR